VANATVKRAFGDLIYFPQNRHFPPVRHAGNACRWALHFGLENYYCLFVGWFSISARKRFPFMGIFQAGTAKLFSIKFVP